MTADESPTQAQSLTARISMWSARHRRLVVLGWLIAMVLALGVCSSIEANTDVPQQAPGETQEAVDLIEERFGEEEDQAVEFVVFLHPSLNVDDPVYEETVQGLTAELLSLRSEETQTRGGTSVLSGTRIVSAATTHYDVGAPRDVSPFVSTRDGKGDVTFAVVELEGEFDEAMDNVGAVLDLVAEYERPEGFEILIGGDASVWDQSEALINEDFNRATVLNLPITFVILILAFGALLAAFVPLILAFAAIFVALGTLTIVSQGTPLADVYTQVVLMIGLATGIDYALFVITRFRNERQEGRSKDDALRIATGTSTKAVVFAGSTTVFAVTGMFLVGDPIFSSLGLASIVIVLFAVTSALTLLPALIAFLGDNVNRFSIPILSRRREGGVGVWAWVIDRVLKRPAIPAVATVAVLLAISAPILTLNLGFNAAKGLHDDVEAKTAFVALEENFTLGLAQPAIVVVDAGEQQNVFAPEIQGAVAEFRASVEAESVAQGPENFYGETARAPEFSDAGDTEILYLPINGDSGEPIAIDAVNHLRDDLVPASFDQTTADVLVTGNTAANIDFRANIIFRTPFVVGFVLLLAFLILLLTFRSVVVAVTAMFLNLLSVGFAYGLLVLVFQEGYLLEGLLDFEATGIIESWLPLFLFSILFGLSIDYEMYVMTRIKELKERGFDTQRAIAEGVKGTAGVITSAAAIMVAVSLIFAFTRNIGLQQFGFGLAMAIAIDATVIRAFVLPTVMKLLGEWNWYFPSWLEWLPRIPMAE